MVDGTGRIFKRRAEWVWTRPPVYVDRPFGAADEAAWADDVNRFVYFRRSFTRRGTGPLPAYLSADGRYKLFVNGTLVGRGPARCHPEYQHVDCYDLAPFTRAGANVIACLVHSYGEDTSWYVRQGELQRQIFGCGGFFFQADDDDDGLLDTGTGQWRFLISQAWNPDTPMLGPGFAEDYSFSRAPAGWQDPEFDSEEWAVPFPQFERLGLGQTTVRPFPVMTIPVAKRLVDRSPVRPVVSELDAGAANNAGFESTSAPPPSAWLLDFGQTRMGRFFFDAECERDGVEVVFAHSERLTSSGGALIPDPVPGISTPAIHRVHLQSGHQRFESFEAAGFRYIEIQSLSSGTTMTGFGIIPSEYPAEDVGSFRCSDPELNEIWGGSALTVRLCRQDGFIDCPSREQRQWTGDSYIQALLGYLLHADPAPAERTLLQIAETQRPDGMVMMSSVSDLSAHGKIFIPDFGLWWVVAMETHLLYTGRTGLLERLVPSAVRLLGWFEDFRDEEGLLRDVPGWNYLDWSEELDRSGQGTTINCLFVRALRALATVAATVGMESLVARLESVADDTARAINERLYDPARGLYADARDGELSGVFSQVANGAAVAFGIAPESLASRIATTITDRRIVTLTKAWRYDSDRPFDPSSQIVMAQPFGMHLVHQACARSGDIGALIDSVRQWLPMIRRNGTAWEHWQDTPVTSLCHAYSATPAFDLPAHLLGIRPTKPGFTEFSVSPHLAGLEWAEASVPTPYGTANLHAKKVGDGLVLVEVTVPPNTAATVVAPAAYEIVDGEDPNTATLSPGSHRRHLRPISREPGTPPS